MRNVLIIGAGGQIGTELCLALSKNTAIDKVLASDIRKISFDKKYQIETHILDALNKEDLLKIVTENNISEVYHLAATLSANAEKNPEFSWNLNMQSLLNVLDLGKEKLVEKIFWPSSIAVFGSKSPSENSPQDCIMNPSTVYGISKLAGEQWCKYYFDNYNVDVRSIRFPGLLGFKSSPGGGTTDYALWALESAAKNEPYTSFLNEKSALPMMHIEDAVQGLIKLMEAEFENVKIRTSYNIQALSFSPETLESQIKKLAPNFKMFYKPDFRQKIANTWPSSLDDRNAKEDWGWSFRYDFNALVSNILEGFKKRN